MGVDRIVFNIPGFDELRNSDGVVRMIEEVADNIQGAAGPGFVASKVKRGAKRAKATVGTTDYQSRLDNARNDTLLRALGSAGRG